MNMIDLIVVRVLSEPREAYGKWWVDVVASAWGTESKNTVMLQTREEAESVKPGFKFMG